MTTARRLRFDDLWTPAKPLPAKQILHAIAARCAVAWRCNGLTRRMRIGYNPRLRSTVGRAVLAEYRVELNPRLLMEHPRELVPTLVHELAHLVIYHRYGQIPPHGEHFRSLMRAVRLPAQATHNLPTAHLRRKRSRYLYLHRCSDCSYSFVRRSVRRGYYCVACGPGMSWDVFRAPDTPKGRQLIAGARGR